MFTISDFRKWRPDLMEAAEVSVHGTTYYVVKGPYARPLPSDRSEFYFDANGNFLAWNSDVGDSAEPRILHPANTSRKKISITAIPDLH